MLHCLLLGMHFDVWISSVYSCMLYNVTDLTQSYSRLQVLCYGDSRCWLCLVNCWTKASDWKIFYFEKMAGKCCLTTTSNTNRTFEALMQWNALRLSVALKFHVDAHLAVLLTWWESGSWYSDYLIFLTHHCSLHDTNGYSILFAMRLLNDLIEEANFLPKVLN